MANNLNQCNFIGRLGNDPEIRFTQGGDAVANISLAVGESWKDKNGNKQESTEWVRGVAFGKLAEIFRDYTRKGSKLFISAKCKTRKWQNQQGQDQYTTEFVINQMEMLDSQSSNGQANQNQAPQQNGYQNQQPPAQQRPQYAGNEPQVSPPQHVQAPFEDEIPFN
jgi:single-strand DNA-binding protein